MEQPNENEELRRSAPTLFGLPKRDPFVVEKGSFDRLPHAVQERITASQQRTAFSWPKWIAIALPVVALLTFGIRWMTPTTEIVPVAERTITPFSDEELEGMDLQEMVAVMSVDTDVDWDSVRTELSDEELLAYIEYEQLDLHEVLDYTE